MRRELALTSLELSSNEARARSDLFRVWGMREVCAGCARGMLGVWTRFDCTFSLISLGKTAKLRNIFAFAEGQPEAGLPFFCVFTAFTAFFASKGRQKDVKGTSKGRQARSSDLIRARPFDGKVPQ